MCTLRTNQLTYERKREELRLSMKMKWVKVNVWELYRSHPMKKRDHLDARIRSDCLLRGLDGLSWGLSPLQRESPDKIQNRDPSYLQTTPPATL